jgi:transposase
MHLSPEPDGDGPHGRELLLRFERGQIRHVLGGAAYDGEETRETIRQLEAKACIKPSKTRQSQMRYDQERYKHRNQVERFFNRIKQCRRVATRYEKTSRTSRDSSGSLH